MVFGSVGRDFWVKGGVREDVRVSNPATRILDGFSRAVDDATCEGAGGRDAGLDAAGDEVVVGGHGWWGVLLWVGMGSVWVCVGLVGSSVLWAI